MWGVCARTCVCVRFVDVDQKKMDGRKDKQIETGMERERGRDREREVEGEHTGKDSSVEQTSRKRARRTGMDGWRGAEIEERAKECLTVSN